MNPIFVIFLIWTWHLFWIGLLTYAIGRSAYLNTGSPFCSRQTARKRDQRRFCCFIKWPIAGRWLLTLLCVMLTVMLGDIAKVAWKVWANDYPNSLTWMNVVVRASPLWIEPWTFSRQWRRGLINDYDR